MGFGIKRNLASIQVQRSVSLTTDRLNQSFQRLASGLRINRSTDDAAGLAIAESLKADSRIASVSMRNANDGMSIIAITDGAVGQITQVLSRLIELSEQSANGAYSNVQRSALQNEFSALMSEIERVAHTTTFNGRQLLSGGGELAFQVGFDGTTRLEAQAPWSVFGDWAGDYIFGNLVAGSHTVTARTYSGKADAAGPLATLLVPAVALAYLGVASLAWRAVVSQHCSVRMPATIRRRMPRWCSHTARPVPTRAL